MLKAWATHLMQTFLKTCSEFYMKKTDEITVTQNLKIYS